MRRYIGERYVPIVDGAWDNTKTYEPLTMVSNSNNIYISKNYVPAGINISNTDYWALMMDYSAIIAEVASIQNDLGDISSASAVTGNSAFLKISTLGNLLTKVKGLELYKANIDKSSSASYTIPSGTYWRVSTFGSGYMNCIWFVRATSNGEINLLNVSGIDTPTVEITTSANNSITISNTNTGNGCVIIFEKFDFVNMTPKN